MTCLKTGNSRAAEAWKGDCYRHIDEIHVAVVQPMVLHLWWYSMKVGTLSLLLCLPHSDFFVPGKKYNMFLTQLKSILL